MSRPVGRPSMIANRACTILPHSSCDVSRSLRHLIEIVAELQRRDVGSAASQERVDTTTPERWLAGAAIATDKDTVAAGAVQGAELEVGVLLGGEDGSLAEQAS
jgi:hypothetical protein